MFAYSGDVGVGTMKKFFKLNGRIAQEGSRGEVDIAPRETVRVDSTFTLLSYMCSITSRTILDS